MQQKQASNERRSYVPQHNTITCKKKHVQNTLLQWNNSMLNTIHHNKLAKSLYHSTKDVLDENCQHQICILPDGSTSIRKILHSYSNRNQAAHLRVHTHQHKHLLTTHVNISSGGSWNAVHEVVCKMIKFKTFIC